ncbi:hypothetical protein [Bartonella apihabitans]|uniref:hypothetical protein n=1 Tax=Bartonella apihabitans TaxID=2750929 RepID=UPI003BB576F2
MHFAILSKLESDVSKTKDAAKGAAQYAKPETFLDESFQNGQKSKKTRGEAQTSFMRGRREFGGVRNVCDKSFQNGQKSKENEGRSSNKLYARQA